MKIIVVGCGKIGRAIIESLVDEKHNIIAIDNNPQVIQSITDTFDVMAICGSATSREMLLAAGVSKADLFICATEQDEVNMLSCFLAKKMGAKHTIARIRESNYNEDGLEFLIKQLDLSLAINPELLTAENLFNRLKLPSAVTVETFAGKKFQLLQTTLRIGSPLIGSTLAQLRTKSPVSFVACAVLRDEQSYIPTGTFELQLDDKVAFMVKRTDLHKFIKALGLAQKQAHDVIMVGASTIAYYLAKMLANSNYNVKIIEKDLARCEEVSAMLPSHTSIILGNASDQELLAEEGIATTDAFVALTGSDEENILTGFYAMSQKVPKVIAKVNDHNRSIMAEKLGLTAPVSPQKIVADVLTRYVRALENTQESAMETMYTVMDGKAEALEFVVLENCRLIGKKLKELKLKEGTIIAGIVRGKDTIIPFGEDTIELGDRVIVVGADVRLFELDDILR